MIRASSRAGPTRAPGNPPALAPKQDFTSDICLAGTPTKPRHHKNRDSRKVDARHWKFRPDRCQNLLHHRMGHVDRVILSGIHAHPTTVGAIRPSGPALARVATTTVPTTGSPAFLELGPGTGALTTVIQQRLAGSGQHVAIELDPWFAGPLATQFPEADNATGDATALRDLLGRRGMDQVDVVVSGLPWAAFDEHRNIASCQRWPRSCGRTASSPRSPTCTPDGHRRHGGPCRGDCMAVQLSPWPVARRLAATPGVPVTSAR